MAIVRTVPPSNSSANPAPNASERISSAFEKLTASAKDINEVSSDLAKPVYSIEHALQNLNLGVACWTKISGDSDGYNYWSHEVGYSRIKRHWCLGIRTAEGNEANPEDESEEVWPFNEAPLYLRIKAVDKLPDLIEAMIDATNATTKRVKEKVSPTQEIAAAVSALINQRKK